jgi:hypothetical protein
MFYIIIIFNVIINNIIPIFNPMMIRHHLSQFSPYLFLNHRDWNRRFKSIRFPLVQISFILGSWYIYQLKFPISIVTDENHHFPLLRHILLVDINYYYYYYCYYYYYHYYHYYYYHYYYYYYHSYHHQYIYYFNYIHDNYYLDQER